MAVWQTPTKVEEENMQKTLPLSATVRLAQTVFGAAFFFPLKLLHSKIYKIM
jgi:hypothetical protein